MLHGASPAGRRASCLPRLLPETSMERVQSRSAGFFAVFGGVLGHLPPAGAGHASLDCSQNLAWRAFRASQLVYSLSLVVSWVISRLQARVVLASIAPKNQHGGCSEQVSWLLRCLWSCLGASLAGRRSCLSLACAAASSSRAGFRAFVPTA